MAGQGDEEMQVQSTKLNVNWLNFNMPTIAAIVGLGVLFWNSAQSVGEMQAQISGLKESSVARSAVADKKFDDIQQNLVALSNTPYRVGVLEQGLLATNQRMDQFLQSLGIKIDGISDRVNVLSTKVEVLSQKIEAITPAKRAELGAPPELVR